MVFTTAEPQESQVCAACQGPGKSACSGCFLVVYCSRNCQVSHRKQHKKWCTSPLIKTSWQPRFFEDGRPAVLPKAATSMKLAEETYFWGNVPAVDIIKLEQNEGLEYNKDMSLLFAASGDMRNVIESIVSLPPAYTSRVCLVINDLDFDIVARNIIIALISLHVADPNEAADCMLHLWYSAFIRQTDLDVLSLGIRPMIQAAVNKASELQPGTMFARSWRTASQNFRVELSKEKWSMLLSFLDVPAGLNAEKAQCLRSDVIRAPEQFDERDRIMMMQLPAHRVCLARFREDGMLLPFGHSRKQFQVPNPTLFHTRGWTVPSEANPIKGWSWPNLLRVESGAAKNDIWGKLFFYARNRLRSFIGRLQLQEFKFSFFNNDAQHLSSFLTHGEFARIETSNIADQCYVGTDMTVRSLMNLLQDPATNPHATLLTMSMNGMGESFRILSPQDATNYVDLELARLRHYKYPIRVEQGSKRFMEGELCALVRDIDSLFDQYMKLFRFRETEKLSFELLEGGCSMKLFNTIVEKWPNGLKLKFDQPGAEEEFNMRRLAATGGVERYVEWKRGV